jgi:Mrp family chromosome partitioning ATPase
VIIDLPPIIGLADTVRLAMAADGIALVIRWGRTERQFVQFALDTLRSANVSTIGVILNDIDLKAQRRRGYRDHTVVYADRTLYRVAPENREPATPAALPTAAAADPDAPELQTRHTHSGRPRSAGSDIERLYDRYHD